MVTCKKVDKLKAVANKFRDYFNMRQLFTFNYKALAIVFTIINFLL